MTAVVNQVPQTHPREPAAPAEAPSDVPFTVIERRRGWKALDLRDVWRHRELLYFLAWRDVKVRYKQTALGAAWAVLQPVAMMIIFTVLFGRLVGLSDRTGGVPYPVFVFTGLLPWMLFANAVNSAANSVVASQNIITKIAFPRLLIPLAAVGTHLIDFLVGGCVLAILMAWYGTWSGWQFLLVPVLVVLVLMAALAVGVLASALSVAYRDFRYVVPFSIQIMMYMTPVIYPVTIVPERFRWFLALNPMTGLVEGFRYSLLGQPVTGTHLATAVGITVVGLGLSILCFRRMETTFADII